MQGRWFQHVRPSATFQSHNNSGSTTQFSSVQSLSRVRLFATPGLQRSRLPCPSPAPSLLKLMSIESAMPSAHSSQNVASQTRRCESYSLSPHSERQSCRLGAGSHAQLHPGPCCRPTTQCRHRLSVPDKTFSPGCEGL